MNCTWNAWFVLVWNFFGTFSFSENYLSNYDRDSPEITLTLRCFPVYCDIVHFCPIYSGIVTIRYIPILSVIFLYITILLVIVKYIPMLSVTVRCIPILSVIVRYILISSVIFRHILIFFRCCRPLSLTVTNEKCNLWIHVSETTYKISWKPVHLILCNYVHTISRTFLFCTLSLRRHEQRPTFSEAAP